MGERTMVPISRRTLAKVLAGVLGGIALPLGKQDVKANPELLHIAQVKTYARIRNNLIQSQHPGLSMLPLRIAVAIDPATGRAWPVSQAVCPIGLLYALDG